jgi:hypothetical protein
MAEGMEEAKERKIVVRLPRPKNMFAPAPRPPGTRALLEASPAKNTPYLEDAACLDSKHDRAKKSP